MFADPSFLTMFTFPMIKGNTAEALSTPDAIVITDKIAQKYFGTDEPIGEQLSLQIGNAYYTFTVYGVTTSVPSHSSIQFSFLIPFARMAYVFGDEYLTDWSSFETNTFILLDSSAQPTALEAKSRSFAEKYLADLLREADDNVGDFRFQLQSFPRYHLGDIQGGNGLSSTGNRSGLYILSGIVLLILLTACFNFMNISIGLSSTRFKEIGTRKVLGSKRIQLIRQFLEEAIVMVFFSMIAGILLALLFWPAFTALTGLDLVPQRYFLSWQSILAVVGFGILLGLFAGSYPAFLLTRYHSADIFKGRQKLGGNNVFTRSIIILQFAVSVTLIICTIVITQQVTYWNNKPLGFTQERVVVIPFGGGWYSTSHLEDNYRLFKNEILNEANILKVTGISSLLTRGLSSTSVQKEGRRITIYRNKVDIDFLETLQIKLIAGRNFLENSQSDIQNSIIVNEAFVRELELKTPLGAPLEYERISPVDNPVIIGVVEDFNFRSLKYKIDPQMLMLHPSRPIRYALVKIAAEDAQFTIDSLKRAWSKINPDLPFNYYYLDEVVASNYRNEQKWSRISRYAASIAIVIACLGLFGLVSLVVAHRSKEIGIRKVLGASVPGIVKLLSSDFMLLILLSNILSWPVGYFIMKQWLRNYTYHTDLKLYVFITATFITVLITLLTISYHSVKAALANPVDSLKYE